MVNGRRKESNHVANPSREIPLFNSRASFEVEGKKYNYYRLEALKEAGIADPAKLPFTIKILLESVLRLHDGFSITEEHVRNLAKWGTDEVDLSIYVPYKPGRVILQDFTGVPAVVDLASLRKAMADLNGDPNLINPHVPVDLVIDHSVQVDKAGTPDSLMFNMEKEFSRNEERYNFLSWAQKAFTNYKAVPPGVGIIHQVNLEYLASVVTSVELENGELQAFPDTLVGTDSHTTMINGIGVLGWGVGGIEAEAGMLGQPSYFPVPEVVGVKLINSLPAGTTATDLVLKITQVLRKHNVVGKFVEFFGPGVTGMSLADRATVANMAPEYGATCGFFPIDEESLNYLRLTGRSEEHVSLVEAYTKANGMFFTPDNEPNFTETVVVDLGEVEPNLAGPKRPQDLIPLSKMQSEFVKALEAPQGHSGFGLTGDDVEKKIGDLTHGSIAIASITSCTNTSNPFVMLGAGLLAKKAVEKGLKVPEYVKTSLAPGSKVVTAYLQEADLLEPLESLGFGVVGYGCATCIGNSGPLAPEVAKPIIDGDLVAAAVVSANRNFEGRVHPLVKANYLASPILVVAYALAGNINFDLQNDSFGKDEEGNDVYLADIWPSTEELHQLVRDTVRPELFMAEYANIFDKNERWNKIQSSSGALYEWDTSSTYIQNPPYFEGLSKKAADVVPLRNLSVIAKMGDTVTTDHISPAGAISKDSPAGRYLLDRGVKVEDFNSYGSRRGNHEVMMRGTFANIRIRNFLAPGTEGGYTTHLPSGEVMSIYDAAMRYKEEGTDLMVIAGKDYGMGSSRDWAAKGPQLLGIKAVLVESFERIHRSNLVMMGVLPLQFMEGETAESLGLTGEEKYTIEIGNDVKPQGVVKIIATDNDGNKKEFNAIARFDSEVEIDYYRHGGILQMVLREKLGQTEA